VIPKIKILPTMGVSRHCELIDVGYDTSGWVDVRYGPFSAENTENGCYQYLFTR